MNKLILYLIVIFGSVLVGTILVSFGYMLYDVIFNYLLKKKTPTDISKLKKAPKPIKFSELNEEEVNKHGRKFREFEKFRRFAKGKRDASESDKLNGVREEFEQRDRMENADSISRSESSKNSSKEQRGNSEPVRLD